jgi:nucleoid DNA-binding protein
MKVQRWLLAAGVLALVVLPLLTLQAQPNLPGQYIPGSVTPLPGNPPTQETVTRTVAKRSGLTEQQVAAVLKELGPVMADRLSRGDSFEIPNLGNFRLIRIVGHRELQGNLAVWVPERNTVEFILNGGAEQFVNRPGAVAGALVGQPEFNAQTGGGTPSLKMPNTSPLNTPYPPRFIP